MLISFNAKQYIGCLTYGKEKYTIRNNNDTYCNSRENKSKLFQTSLNECIL